MDDRIGIWTLGSKHDRNNIPNPEIVGSQITNKNSKSFSDHIENDGSLKENSKLSHYKTTEVEAIKPHEITVEYDSRESKFGNQINNRTLNSFYLTYQKSYLLKASSGLLILIFAVLNSTIITVLPQHNVILNPQYWYEPLFPICLGYILIGSIGKNVQCYMVMNIINIISSKSLIVIYLASVFGCSVTYVTIYILWVYGLGQCHPMPFVGHCCTLAMWISNNIALWLLLSTKTGANNNLTQKRIWIYISLAPIILFIGTFYAQFSSFLSKTPTKYQWCLGLLLPFMKKLSTMVATKVALKAAVEESLSAKIAMIANVGSIHSFSVSLLMGSDISSITAYVIIFLDSIPNILSFRKVIKLDRSGLKHGQMEELKCLAVKEFMEISIPIVYCMSFVIAYYGPNAELLGNVKNEYWQYRKVNNVFSKLTNNSIFILVDAIRGAVFGLLLWRLCKLNILKVYCEIISTYGILIWVYISGALAVVSK